MIGSYTNRSSHGSPEEGRFMEVVERVRMPAGPGARRLLERRMRELFRVYPKALLGDAGAVHDVRVAARRLRVALVLLVDRPQGRRARRADRALRKLARAAGRGRDLDVGLGILEATPARVDEANSRLRRSLVASRSRARVVARDTLLDLDVARLRRDLRTMASSTRVDRASAAARIASIFEIEEDAVGRLLSAADARPSPETLHAARRSARRLRYAAEVADLLDGAESGVAGRWRKLQTRLGEIQDRHVLALWLAARAARASALGDLALAVAAGRALTRVRRDVAARTRAFLAARDIPASQPPR
jgi:CHAD domain-containing protein